MMVFWMAFSLTALLCCGVLAWRFWRQRRKIARLTEQMGHFALTSDEPLKETLAEGETANLHNQVSRLEQMVLYERKSAVRRERQMVRFTENMAHQMKNALTALQIQLDMVALSSDGKTQEALQKGQDCMDRLTGEIEKILKSSQLAEGKITMRFAQVNLFRELQEVRNRLLPIASSRNVTVALLGAGDILLPADSFWLSQALENIMKNAIEHTAPDTQVTVSAARTGGTVRITVEDQGKGLPAEELPVLFERFHRGETAKAGYGIGLSLAKDIVAAHHGTLTARNGETGGAVLEIILPILEGTSPYQAR